MLGVGKWEAVGVYGRGVGKATLEGGTAVPKLQQQKSPEMRQQGQNQGSFTRTGKRKIKDIGHINNNDRTC